MVEQIATEENKTETEILESLPGVGENPTIDTAYPNICKNDDFGVHRQCRHSRRNSNIIQK